MKVSAPHESGHWYSRNGNPTYTVIGANGNTRPTTLRDARKMNLVPSVTTILNVAAKPFLIQWMQKQVLLAALTLPKIDAESDEDYVDRILDDSKAQGRAAADAGTDIHASIQSFYEGEVRNKHEEHVRGCYEAIQQMYGDQAWIAERSFGHDLGFGGKVDLHCPGIVLDVKTKDFSDPKAIEGYDEHLMQLAAYRVGLGMPEARCANVFISRSVPGLSVIREWTSSDLDKGWQMFVRLLEFWQLKHNYK